jgi:hypothetical protein
MTTPSPSKKGLSQFQCAHIATPFTKTRKSKKIMQDLLRSGVIQHNLSPFSSPVLLVRKADGTWMMCMDYRALNKVTIKAKFPIPVVDELLDELWGTNFFSKLDLRFGYHQIRVVDEDIPKRLFVLMRAITSFWSCPLGSPMLRPLCKAL